MKAAQKHRPIAVVTAARLARFSTARASEYDRDPGRFARDPFALVEEGFVRIPDVVTGEPIVPTVYPHQEELARAWIDLDYLARTGILRLRNVLDEKSRQMGMTWWVAVLFAWMLSLHETQLLALSMQLGDVDDGGSGSTTDSFFGKVRYIVQSASFPAQLSDSLEFVTGTIRHRFNDRTYAVGSGATPDPGRGGRYKGVFADEMARLPFGEAAHKSLALACPDGRLYGSTPEGEDNVFARIRRTRPAGFRILRHHWSAHPVYSLGLHIAGDDVEGCDLCAGTVAGLPWTPEDPRSHRYPGKPTSPWYEAAIVELTDEQVASELDIDYAASLTARVYPEFSESAHVATREIPLFPDLPVELAWDYGLDTTAVVIAQDAPTEYRILGEVELHDALPEAVAAAVRAELVALGLPVHLSGSEWTLRMLAVGDPAGEIRSLQTGRPITADYRNLGFGIVSRPRPIDFTIRAVKRLLLRRPKPLVVSPRAVRFIDHMKHNRWPVDRYGNRKPTTEPQNDRHNHMMRAVAYLIAWKFPPPDAGLAVAAGVKGPRSPVGTGRLDDAMTASLDL